MTAVSIEAYDTIYRPNNCVVGLNIYNYTTSLVYPPSQISVRASYVLFKVAVILSTGGLLSDLRHSAKKHRLVFGSYVTC